MAACKALISTEDEDSAELGSVSWGWDNIPTELLCMILRRLDVESLLNCMFVNKKWKSTAQYLAFYKSLWPEIVDKAMINKGRHIRERSMLSPYEMFENYMLWNVVKRANAQNIYSYLIIDVVSMAVNQDHLIANNGADILYYDIDTFRVFREFQTRCVRYDENDFIVARMIKKRFHAQFNTTAGELHLFGKEGLERHRYSHKDRAHCIKHISHFMLQNNCCYAMTINNILWACTYSRKGWKAELVARFYGTTYDTISTIHLYQGEVYIVTNNGDVYAAASVEDGFQKVWHVNLPDKATIATLFHDYDVVIAEPGKIDGVKIIYDAKHKRTQLMCTNLSCATAHGQVLFLGFHSGKVWVCLPWKMRLNISDPKPERVFDVNEICEDKIAPTVYDIQVCERKRSHVLFISTHAHIFQILLSYPDENEKLFDLGEGFIYLYRHLVKKDLELEPDE